MYVDAILELLSQAEGTKVSQLTNHNLNFKYKICSYLVFNSIQIELSSVKGICEKRKKKKTYNIFSLKLNQFAL